MSLAHLQHFLIQTHSIEKTRDWYVEVLGMRAGWNPDFGFPVCWLYIGDVDVLHITEGGAGVSDARKNYLGQQSEALEGTGVIDHVAFRAEEPGSVIKHLEGLGVPYTTRQVNQQGLFQVFLFDPNGVKVELNFDAAAAVTDGLIAEKMAEV